MGMRYSPVFLGIIEVVIIRGSVLPLLERTNSEAGSISEYVLAPDYVLAHKPKNLTHVEAAALPLVSLTAVHTLEKVDGGAVGKTALITSGRECYFSISSHCGVR